MVILEDIRSLSEFQRNSKAAIRRLNKTGRPELLTVNGRASVVVQDAAAYQKLVEELEYAKTAAAIAEAERGEAMPGEEAFAMLRKKMADRRKR